MLHERFQVGDEVMIVNQSPGWDGPGRIVSQLDGSYWEVYSDNWNTTGGFPESKLTHRIDEAALDREARLLLGIKEE